MQIGAFTGSPIHITELESLTKGRLLKDVVIWPKQAVPLVGYMAWPNDDEVRNHWIDAHERNDESGLSAFVRKLKIIQQHWARVADIVHLHYDLTQGQHQQARAGASVGKAIALIDANAKSKGTGKAKLWEIWAAYKDVAHLIAAAVLIAGEVQTRHRMAPYGLKLQQFQPYRMAMLLPELVIGVAKTIEKYGLRHVPRGRTESLLDPESLWRIPPKINVAAIPLPPRKITKTDIAVLNARRAGNRGRVNRRKTTPVFA
ncbi:MAG: hypothetical protein WBF03_05485 [Xanthobacteraceae bacterium]